MVTPISFLFGHRFVLCPSSCPLPAAPGRGVCPATVEGFGQLIVNVDFILRLQEERVGLLRVLFVKLNMDFIFSTDSLSRQAEKIIHWLRGKMSAGTRPFRARPHTRE
jgi:hypothetical protein